MIHLQNPSDVGKADLFIKLKKKLHHSNEREQRVCKTLETSDRNQLFFSIASTTFKFNTQQGTMRLQNSSDIRSFVLHASTTINAPLIMTGNNAFAELFRHEIVAPFFSVGKRNPFRRRQKVSVHQIYHFASCIFLRYTNYNLNITE